MDSSEPEGLFDSSTADEVSVGFEYFPPDLESEEHLKPHYCEMAPVQVNEPGSFTTMLECDITFKACKYLYTLKKKQLQSIHFFSQKVHKQVKSWWLKQEHLF